MFSKLKLFVQQIDVRLCGIFIQWQKDNLNTIQQGANAPSLFFFLVDLLEQLQGLPSPGVEEGLCAQRVSALRRMQKPSS